MEFNVYKYHEMYGDIYSNHIVLLQMLFFIYLVIARTVFFTVWSYLPFFQNIVYNSIYTKRVKNTV